MGIFTDISGLKNIGIIGIGNLVGSAISALFWIYLAGLLGAENYGELGYYISIAGIASSNNQNIDKELINLKGKTVEKLGLIGKEKAIACEVICSITQWKK